MYTIKETGNEESKEKEGIIKIKKKGTIKR
jgi:hypothetical protein